MEYPHNKYAVNNLTHSNSDFMSSEYMQEKARWKNLKSLNDGKLFKTSEDIDFWDDWQNTGDKKKGFNKLHAFSEFANSTNSTNSTNSMNSAMFNELHEFKELHELHELQ